MRRKETVAVVILCSMTTILKICSIVAIYSYKVHEVKKRKEAIHLTHNTITNDLLCQEEEHIKVKPQYDIKFKQTVATNR